MKALKYPANFGSILVFIGFLSLSYSASAFVSDSGLSFKSSKGEVLATCTSDGAYGQTCISNESFEIEKKVRVKGNSTWKDKVTNVEEKDTVEFRVKVTNTGDDEEDKLKMSDSLPDEMSRTGGDDLTEEWNDFAADEDETFIIEAQLKSSEFDSTVSFEKCIVNKAELEQAGDYKGSDTATVCYNNADIEELPDTGPLSPIILGVSGLVMTFVGGYLKKKD
jgi:uncharacterized repeat protein (TIGR01451 family)